MSRRTIADVDAELQEQGRRIAEVQAGLDRKADIPEPVPLRRPVIDPFEVIVRLQKHRNGLSNPSALTIDLPGLIADLDEASRTLNAAAADRSHLEAMRAALNGVMAPGQDYVNSEATTEERA